MPSTARITVGIVELTDVREALWPRLMALLSDEERARAARFQFEKNRRQHLAAHGLKRLMLCEAAGGAPLDWAFTTESNGKPCVAGGGGPQFNLSHCDGLVACAVSLDVRLGVDVEVIAPRVPLDIADRYFAPDECAWLFGLPEAERPRGFLRLWTMKEAFIKATGEGLSRELHSFAVGFEPLRVTLSGPLRAGEGDEWRFMQDTIGTNHIISLAWHGPGAEVTMSSVRLEELMP